MAITLFGAATTPADNAGSSLGPTVVLTPPASMQDGDLVLVSVRYRASSTTLTVSDAAGQDWQSTTQYNATNIRARLFWCRFNGTWSGSGTPSFTVTSGGNNIDAQMIVFRPTSAAYTWTLESGPNGATYAAPSTPFTVTITGRTTVAASTVTLGCWHSVDDNSWGTLSGTGWSKTNLTAQYRNNDTADNSSSFAYYIATAASTAVPNVSQNQTALGGDAGSTALFTFAETLVTALPGGQAATGSVGALGLSITSTGVLGVSSTLAAGVASVPVSGNATAAVTGVSSSAAAGTDATLISSVASPAGSVATPSAGTVGGAAVAVLSGASSTVAAGTAVGVPANAGGVAIGGVVGSPTAGSLAAASVVAGIAGVSGSSAAGSLVANAGGAVSANVTPLGVSASGSAQPLGFGRAVVGLAGLSSAAVAGTAVGTAAGITGGAGQASPVFATAQVGLMAISLAQPIVGVVAAATAESLALSASDAEADGATSTATAGAPAEVSIVSPAGVSAATQAGSVSLVSTAVCAPSGVASPVVLGSASGVSSGNAVVVLANVQSACVAGSVEPAWTNVAEVVGVECSGQTADVAVEGGDTVSTEVFPGGVEAVCELGALTPGEAHVALFGLLVSARAGSIAAVARSPADVTCIRGTGRVRRVRARATMRNIRARGRTPHG